MSLNDYVIQNYQKLNESDLYIWEYITNHRNAVTGMSINELAEKCNVSRTTIMRFAQRIGLKGFSELKTYLRWEKKEVNHNVYGLVNLVCDNKIQMINHYRHVDLHFVISTLQSANRIFVYGTGSLQREVAKEMKRMFLAVGIIIYDVAGEGELSKIVTILKKDDVVIFISKTGVSEFIREKVIYAKHKNVKIISITRSSNNPLAILSDFNFNIVIEEIPVTSETTFESMIPMFFLVEIIFTKYAEYINRKNN